MKKNEIKSIELANYQIKDILDRLNVPLHSEKARARNRIVEILGPIANATEKERLALVDKYAEKDENNKPVIVMGEFGKDHYKLTDDAAFQKEWQEVQAVKNTFDILPSNRMAWIVVREMWEKTTREMDINETILWEEIINALKGI